MLMNRALAASPHARSGIIVLAANAPIINRAAKYATTSTGAFRRMPKAFIYLLPPRGGHCRMRDGDNTTAREVV